MSSTPTKRTIIVATGNLGKMREFADVLAGLPVELKGLKDIPAIPEPEEDGKTFADNARAKAMYYAKATGQWCLADDSGLEVDALGGEPGVYSARYAADQCPPDSPREVIDQANNRKLLAKLAGVPDEQRTARFVCHLALSNGRRILIETFDTIEGRIGYEPRGQNGFGYDPLFNLPELGKTTAQLPSDQKNAISHRGKAARFFASLLRSVLASRADHPEEDVGNED